MDFGLSQDQVLLKDTIRRWLEAECPTSRVRARHGERDRSRCGALARARRSRGRRTAGAAGARRRRPRAARRGAGGGGAGLGLHARAVPRQRDGDGRRCSPRTTRRRIAAGCRASRPARSSPRSRSARSGDEWDADEARDTRPTAATLHGQKTLVPAADVADLLVVAARDAAGPGLWLVERGAPGLEVSRPAGHGR